jgi:hypothetical protein
VRSFGWINGSVLYDQAPGMAKQTTIDCSTLNSCDRDKQMKGRTSSTWQNIRREVQREAVQPAGPHKLKVTGDRVNAVTRRWYWMWMALRGGSARQRKNGAQRFTKINRRIWNYLE